MVILLFLVIGVVWIIMFFNCFCVKLKGDKLWLDICFLRIFWWWVLVFIIGWFKCVIELLLFVVGSFCKVMMEWLVDDVEGIWCCVCCIGIFCICVFVEGLGEELVCVLLCCFVGDVWGLVCCFCILLGLFVFIFFFLIL